MKGNKLMIILIILSILTISCATVSAADVNDTIISDVESDSTNLGVGDSENVDDVSISNLGSDSTNLGAEDSENVDIVQAAETEVSSSRDTADGDSYVLGDSRPVSSNVSDISMYEADANYSENHYFTINLTDTERNFLSHFREVSSGYYFHHNQHPANIYWTAVEEDEMYMIFYMDEDDYKNMHAFLEFNGQRHYADLYIANMPGYNKIGVARFTGINGTTGDAYFETNRNHGPPVKIDGIQILNQTNTTLYVNDKFEDTIYVGEDATLKAIVNLLNYVDVPVTEGIVSYFLVSINGTPLINNISNLPNEEPIGFSVPGGTILIEQYPIGDYEFIAWYHDDTQTHNFESHSNRVILHVIGAPEVDLEVNKTVNVTAAVTQGDYVNFTIEVTNNGPKTATNIVVNDKLPNGLAFVSFDASVGTYDEDSGDWTIPELEKDAIATLNIIAHVTGVGTLTNTATVTSCRENDTNSSNNVSSVEVTSNPAVDKVSIGVIKDVMEDKDSIYYGQEITYIINVTNHGPNATDGVVINDKLPEGLEFVSYNASVGTYDKDSGNWTIGSLGVNQTVSLKIIVTINSLDPINNTAKLINHSGEDVSTVDDEDSVIVTAKPLVDLMIIKELIKVNGEELIPDVRSGVSIHYGDEVTFLITVINWGPCNATDVIVTDKLPEGLEFVSYNASVGEYYPNSGIWIIGNLNNGTDATLEIVANVTKFGETITNIANVTSNEKDNFTDNNNDTVEIDPYEITDLAITIEAPGSVLYGETFEFIINVTNNGPCNATEVIAILELPAEFEYISSRELLGNTSGFNQSTGDWAIGELNVGDTVQLAILVKANELGKFNITAYVEGAEDETTLDNNFDKAEVEVKPYADLSLEKSVDKTEITVGNTVTYTFKVTNNGPFNATGVKVTDSDITKHTFVSASSGDYDSSTGLWNVGELANGESKTLTVTVRISEVGEFANNAVVSSDQYDNNTSNNNASSNNVTVTAVPNEEVPDEDVPNEEVPDEEVPDEEGSGEEDSDGDIPDESDDLATEDSTTKEMETSVLPKTGNPLLVLLLALIVLTGAMFGRKE
ncbi:DUF11 domain-containing protein [Methanobrevibacter olleyae]|uniref:Adhesin-like protein n=1 Tax=Methanobrevibacter olleyae TaxID=294671 RepID=A0A126QXQ2_METOL|nr:DUF11 domain-containing protein [Methanobrevibacter olleyae]AMK14572.1 adhesin-like protein [Methanobrevibacter olleyae]